MAGLFPTNLDQNGFSDVKSAKKVSVSEICCGFVKTFFGLPEVPFFFLKSFLKKSFFLEPFSFINLPEGFRSDELKSFENLRAGLSVDVLRSFEKDLAGLSDDENLFFVLSESGSYLYLAFF